jgi:hypothetical protein
MAAPGAARGPTLAAQLVHEDDPYTWIAAVNESRELWTPSMVSSPAVAPRRLAAAYE